MTISNTLRTPRLPLAAGLLLSLAACAGVPKPTAELARSVDALQAAEAAGAARHAPLELKHARDKQAAARDAVRDERFGKARRLAEQASVDAELAAAKSDARRSDDALKAVEDSLETMRSEVQRVSDR